MHEPKLKRGDIVLGKHPYRQDVYVILHVIPLSVDRQYVAIRPETGKLCDLSDEHVLKIGEATAEYMACEGRIQPENLVNQDDYLAGKQRAEKEAKSNWGEDQNRWAILAEAKPGDLIRIHNHRGSEMVKFQCVLDRGIKYVFLAENAEQKVFRYMLDCICLGHEAGHKH
jgi:hypothetical protein